MEINFKMHKAKKRSKKKFIIFKKIIFKTK